MEKFREEKTKMEEKEEHLKLSIKEVQAAKADRYKREMFNDLFYAATSAVAYGLANSYLPAMSNDVVHYAGAVIVGLLSTNALGSMINYGLYSHLAKKSDLKKQSDYSNENEEEVKRER